MEYPANFETAAFPAGKRIAVSRFMAIGISLLSVVVIALALVVMWVGKSHTVDPFIISVNDITGQWEIVGHSHGRYEYSPTRTMQESVIGNFARDWFAVSDMETNNALWQVCDREQDCQSSDKLTFGDKTCALFCESGEDVFNRFIYDVVPDYTARAETGERIVLDVDSLEITPLSQITENGGVWRVNAILQSNIMGQMRIIAFAHVMRNTAFYPRTLGYYVSDFNAYRQD